MVRKANVDADIADALNDPPPIQSGVPEGIGTNGGGKVPAQEGTQVGTSGGTSRGTKGAKKKSASDDTDLDFSLDGLLSEAVDPETDWRKAGWSAKRYRKKTVEVLVSIGWRGYRTEQELVDAALASFLPDSVQEKSREKAARGEL